MAIRVPPPGVSFGGFTVGPAGAVAPGGNAVALPAVSMQSPRPAPGKKKKNKNKQQQNQQQQQQNQQQTPATAPSSSTPASDGKTAAEKREEQRQRQAARQAAREEARRNRFNPFTAPFKSPAELRAEAARLAALGAPSEADLRAQQQREEAGLTGLTTATAGALQNILGETQAGLRAFGDVYGRVGAGATSAAESALAAAGAPTSVAPTVSEADRARLGSQLAAYSAPLLGLPGAAQATGQRLIGASQANLAKALTQRASQISSDTAKYLQQLQNLEYEKAVAQETARQNLARLELSAGEAQRDYEIAQANLGLRRESVAQGWYNAETSRMRAMRTGNKNTDSKNAKKDILGNLDKWTAADSGIGDFEISAQGQVPGEIIGPVKVQATDAASAEARVKELYPDTFGATTSSFNITYAGPAAIAGRAPDAVWKARIRNYMMTVGGMTKAQANAFIKNQVIPSLGL